MSDSLRPHGLQHTRPPCPSPTPSLLTLMSIESVMHPTISSSVVPFSPHLQSFPASGSFLMSQFFESGAQTIGVLASASALPVNIQGGFLLGLTSLISLPTMRLLRVPWTARRSKQLILKEISPEYSLERPMLKLKLQNFGHLMRRTLARTLMLGKIEGRRRRG